jgi:hypothetical protein
VSPPTEAWEERECTCAALPWSASACLLTPFDDPLVPSFIQEAKPEIIQQLTADVKSCEEDLDKLKASKEYLERAVKETEGSITELLRTNDTLARQILKQ